MLKKYIGLTSLSLLFCLWGTQTAIADTLVRFNPPPDNPQPEKTVLGGRRSPKNCGGNADTQPNLTALIPENQKGLTTEQYPTFWAYIPKTSAQQLILSIHEQVNGQFQPYSQQYFPVPDQPGLVSLRMSDQKTPLKVDKTYKWTVVLVCNGTTHPNDPVIEGLVSRVNVASNKQQQSLLERSAWYGEKGIWYDSLAYLAEARHQSPNNPILLNNWIELLKSVGLSAFTTAPLLF